MDTPTTAPKPGPAPMLYLASQSPRRRELLAQWGVSCEALVADPSEDAEALEEVRRGESPTAYVQRVTRNKLHAALTDLPVTVNIPPQILTSVSTANHFQLRKKLISINV